MFNNRAIYLVLFLFINFTKSIFAQEDSVFTVTYFQTLPKISIRALEAVSEKKVWFAANHGVWGYTEDAGKTWHIDSIKVDTTYPQFRSIAVLNDSTVLLLSVASPGYLFKTTNKGKTWQLVFTNPDKDIFYDCMYFYNSTCGIALADPIGGCCHVIRTSDAGATWTLVDCGNITKPAKGEACFAASNSNIAVYSNNVWFVTGGMRARIFHSDDMGNHFRAYNTPLPEGDKMTGIFSVDFCDNLTGVIAGGNYVKSDSTDVTMAITNNGGVTWKPISSKKPIFGSCIKFRNANEFYITGSDGTYLFNLKSKKITEVKDNTKTALKYNTLRFSPNGKALWLAGNKGTIALVDLKRRNVLHVSPKPRKGIK